VEEKFGQDDFFVYKFPQPQYLGAKQKHLKWMEQFFPKEVVTVLDPFSGSQSVAFFLKQLGKKVITNDFLEFNNQIGKALVENRSVKLSDEDVELIFSDNSDPKYYNLFEETFSNLFYSVEDCKIIDAARSNIEKLDGYKKNLAFAIMNRTLTRKVTMGHFGHTVALKYASDPLRVKRNRSLVRPIKDIFLDLLPLYNNAVFDNNQENKSFCEGAIELIKKTKDVDLLYLDPPYCCSHADYQSFYHLLETFTNYWKDKEFINSTKMYFPKRKSGFDIKKEAINSFEKLFSNSASIPFWVISYNNRSYPKQEELVKLISKYKNVEVFKKKYENNVGGKGSVKNSYELLFFCTPKKEK